jgi:hypothetical protein
MCFISKDCILRTKFGKIVFKPYFINYYFTILKRIEFKLYFFYFMQTSPSCFVHNVLLKTPLLLENLFYY